MIRNDQELEATLKRIDWMQNFVAHLRREEKSVANYHGSASGFLAEIGRMQLDVRNYFLVHPSEMKTTDS